VVPPVKFGERNWVDPKSGTLKSRVCVGKKWLEHFMLPQNSFLQHQDTVYAQFIF